MYIEQYDIVVYTPGAMAEKLSLTILYAIFLPAFLSLSQTSIYGLISEEKLSLYRHYHFIVIIVNMLRAGFNKTSVRTMSADRIQRKTARTMSLHRTCVVEKIAVRGQKL